jgi:hypothetical protein
MIEKGTRPGPGVVHGSHCEEATEHAIFRCLECEILFEAGIADPGRSGSERCPQCGLENAIEVARVDHTEVVIRHSSRFR